MSDTKKPSMRLETNHWKILDEHHARLTALESSLAEVRAQVLRITGEIDAKPEPAKDEGEPTKQDDAGAEDAMDWACQIIRWNDSYSKNSLWNRDGLNCGNLQDEGASASSAKKAIADWLTAFAAAQTAKLRETMRVRDIYAITRMLEVFAPADPFITELQTKLGTMRSQLHGNDIQIGHEAAEQVDRLEKMRVPNDAEQLRAERDSLREKVERITQAMKEVGL